MLGVSGHQLNQNIARVLSQIAPDSLLEYGCGRGKLAQICSAINLPIAKLEAVQKLFTSEDIQMLTALGYTAIHDADILEFLKGGVLFKFDVIAALDVIEHFMFSEAISIIDYSLYCCDYFIMVWPSKNLQQSTNPFDVHRTSFELKEIANRFEVIYYSQTITPEISPLSKYHIAVLRGHMNFQQLPALA